MTKDFSRDAANNCVGITKSIEGGLNRRRILMKTTEGFFLAVKKIWAARVQGLDQCIVVAFPRLIDNICTTCSSKKADEIKLLRGKGLFTNNEDTTRNECASLLRDTANKRADLVTLFGRNDIEHGLPGGVRDA